MIITAAILLELLSAAQYYNMHQLMGEELEKRAESELTLKAILTKSMLNDAEDMMKDHLWDIQNHLQHPDSIYSSLERLMENGHHLLGSGAAFVENYFPSKGRLFEPYCKLNEDGSKEFRQIASDKHNYLNGILWQKVMAKGGPVWVEPYTDQEGAEGVVSSYATVIRDHSDSIVGLVALDVSLEGLSDTINSRHIYPSSFVLLLSEDGLPIVQPTGNSIGANTSDYIIKMINDSTVVRHKSTSGRTKVMKFRTDRDGTGRMVSTTVFYANMRGKPHWQIAVVCYDDEVYAPLTKLRLRMLLLMLLAFGFLLFVIWRFARGEKKLQKKTLEQERMAGELRIASNIQQALLPTVDEMTLQGTNDISVEGRLIPAKEVGGDLYNVFMRDGKLFFCIGDVSGKGVPSALIMAIIQTVFRNIASRENNPAHIMTQLNEMACRNNKANVFVTLFIGVLDLPTGHLRYCNAGHEIPILVNDNAFLDVKPNLPVGLFSDFKYEMQKIIMQPGSTLFLYTDGLTEARPSSFASSQRAGQKSSKLELFGRERVMQILADCKTQNVKELVDTVVAEVKKYSENTEQSDDLTLLAISYTPNDELYILDEELTLLNNVKDVAKLSIFAKDVMARLNIGKPLAPKLRLALEEAVVNVMEYAYPAGTVGNVTIRVTCSTPKSPLDRSQHLTEKLQPDTAPVTENQEQQPPAIRHLKFVISDSGASFNPTEATIADTTLSAEERPVGGLGILLVRELMDAINYERIDGKNVLTLMKTLKTEN